jgi:predicted nucleic acid-binding protein
MSVEFIDTSILIYAHEGGAGLKHQSSVELLARLIDNEECAVSLQVLMEFYWAATKKLKMRSHDAEQTIQSMGGWVIHRPAHADVVRAAQLQRKYDVSWWDALILNSATELGCATLWSEDFGNARKYGSVTVKNPFK